MKVTHFDTENRVAFIQLTRRNLLTLLAKLDQNAEERISAEAGDREVNPVRLSKCTIVSPSYLEEGKQAPGQIAVTGVEDFEHYSDREPGPMTAETERRLG